MKCMLRQHAVATAAALIESPLRATTRSEKINHPGSPMPSRQRRARVRAALSTPLVRSQNKRPWHAVLMVFACFSGHANAKTWYYDAVAERPIKFYENVDEFCAAYATRQG